MVFLKLCIRDLELLRGAWIIQRQMYHWNSHPSKDGNALTLALPVELMKARLGEEEGITIQWPLWMSLLASNGLLFLCHWRRMFCHYCRNFPKPMNCLFSEFHELLCFLQYGIFQSRGNYYRKTMLKYCFCQYIRIQ